MIDADASGLDALRWLAVAVGLGCYLGATLLAFDRLRRTSLPKVRRAADAVLVLPLTGPAPSLDRLVAALDGQTLRPRRLIVVVESPDDPAYARALDAGRSARFPMSVIVAGIAADRGQKCLNMQAALAALGPDDDLIVFMDGDVIPQSWWLSALASPIAEGLFDLVAGRRWQRVETASPGAHLVAAVDRGINLLPYLERPAHSVVWGGSIALSRPALQAIGFERALDRALSDDLTLADAANAAGLRILVRGALLVPSPTTPRLVDGWRFGRRQYQICHLYRPWLWRIAALLIHLRLLGVAAALAGGLGTFDLAALAAFATLGLVKQLLVAETARRVGLDDPAGVRLAQAALGVVQPVVDLFHASLILGAAVTRVVSWGHVTYAVDGPHAIRVVRRAPFAAR